ncbi:uncharacterized protein [Mytilus edulis]|uniref:uncharacterized protein n=1 Tax=Mytilus edulis TaxID=6550 RepID=UPI0039EE2FEA
MDFDIHGVLLLVWLCNGLSTSFVLNAVVQHHTQELRCGDHVCHHRQRCLIEMRNVTYLRLRCHHQSHDDIPCSPNSLRSNHRCSCDTRTCVDHTLISLVSAVTTPTIATNQNGLLCGDHVCKGHQFCIIEETQDSKLHPRCADVHNTHHCLPNLLSLGSSCFCDTRTCVDHTLISIVAGHQVAALICSDQDDHSCHADQVCRLHNTNGHLNGQCINKHNETYKQADRDGCPHILGEGHECFCNNNDCVQQTQAATGNHTVTTTNHNDLVCGDHVCHGHQYCIIEEKQDGKLYLKCADVHNTQHCLPHLLSLGSSCFCDTRTCVDHALISIVAGHQVAGLICSDHDGHSCHSDYVCEISIDKNGIKRHCGHGYHMTPCTQLPVNSHEKCYCITQSCVFGHFSAPTTMSTISKPTTAVPTTAPTTIPQTTVQPTTVQPTKAQSTMVQPTTVQPSTSVATTGISTITVALTNTSMVQTASSIPTTIVVTAVSSSTNNTCTDDEDSNFSCVVYETMYGLCAATTGTLFNIAQKRCQAFCGICAGNNTSGTPPAALPTQPTCIDHDARCSQFKFHICSSNVSQNFVISTCPKSCNKCAEYLASLNRKYTV